MIIRHKPHRRSVARRANKPAVITLYLHEVGQVPEVPPKEERALIARIRRGDSAARDRLIKGSLRRVVQISREFEGIHLPLLDLISEGNLGLLKAVNQFNPQQDEDFSSYSTWWIRQSIKRALANGASRKRPRKAAMN